MKFLLSFLFSVALLATTYAQINISGTVTDNIGEPLPGVNVMIKGTSQGVVTGTDGKFSMSVPGNETVLVFSFIGFTSQEITVGERRSFEVLLAEDAQLLDEVVVVGYGTQKKVNLTGSVSVVKFDQELENRPITNATQALAGRSAGLWVSQNTGRPGDDGSTIRIRGYGTLNNTAPLILVDGIEGSLSELNPNDIESITVLKDAASAAIYGSRAANGVILVETKKSIGQERVSINYNGYVGIQQLGMHFDIISNSAEYMTMWNTAIINNGGDPMFPDDVISGFRSGTDNYRYPNTNYFDEVYRNAFMSSHNLSATISSKTSQTYLSLSYLNQDGIVKNTDAQRYGVALNNTTKVNNWLTVGVNSRIMNRTRSQPFDGIERVIYMMAVGHPYTTPYLQDGETFGGTQALYVSGPRAGLPITDTRNPFPDLYNGLDLNKTNFYRANVFATIEFMKGLTLTGNYAVQYTNTLRDRYNQTHFCYTDLNRSNPSKPLDYRSTIDRFRADTDEFYTTFFATLNYTRKFAGVHDITAMLGMQSEDWERKTMDAQKSSPPKEDIIQVTAATVNPVANGGRTQWRMLSYFGRINYALMNKYLFEVNLRADGSSRFAKESRWGYFPSFSAAWRLGEEDFVKNAGIFDNLKLRLSWGQLGNNFIGTGALSQNWPYLTLITQNNGNSYNSKETFLPGAAVNALVDPNISWETTTTSNIGLDLGFFNNRLTFELDVFDKQTKDIIVQLPLPITMGGLAAPYENIGKMSNKGFELTANWQNRTNEISYGFGGNFTYVVNEVTKFQGGKSPDQRFLIREGYSYRELYGYEFEGIYQSDAEAASHMHSESYGLKAGDIKYKDLNGDGRLDYRDKKGLGNTTPKVMYGINGNVAWKGFDFSLLFQGLGKVTGYNQSSFSEPLGISGGSVTKRWRDAWTPQNKSETLPRIRVNDTWNRYDSSFWACNMSWFKLKNVQLGYSIPRSIINQWSISRLYLYVNAQNVFTLVSKDYEGFDPERDTYAVSYNQYPSARVFSFGVNVTF